MNPMVLIVWRDAHADAHGWTEIDDLDIEPRVVRTVGWMLDEVKAGHLSVAQSMDDTRVDQVIHIPDGMVLATVHLHVSEAE